MDQWLEVEPGHPLAWAKLKSWRSKANAHNIVVPVESGLTDWLKRRRKREAGRELWRKRGHYSEQISFYTGQNQQKHRRPTSAHPQWCLLPFPHNPSTRCPTMTDRVDGSHAWSDLPQELGFRGDGWLGPLLWLWLVHRARLNPFICSGLWHCICADGWWLTGLWVRSGTGYDGVCWSRFPQTRRNSPEDPHRVGILLLPRSRLWGRKSTRNGPGSLWSMPDGNIYRCGPQGIAALGPDTAAGPQVNPYCIGP